MLEALTIVTSVVALAASGLTIVLFLKARLRHRTGLLVAMIVAATVVVLSGLNLTERRHSRAMAEAADRSRVNDAKIVPDTILISGWEDIGDHIGYLSLITGFYGRHRELYPDEYEAHKRALLEWQETLGVGRESGRTWSSLDYPDLKGMVKAGDDHMEQLALGQK